MARQSTKKGKGAPGRIKADKEMSKSAEIDPSKEPELFKSLAEMSEKGQADEVNKALQVSQQMSALWSPYLIPILKQLRRKGVDVDTMRALLEQSALDEKSTAKFEQLLQKFSGQRAAILAAMSEVADLKSMERRVKALVSSEGESNLTTDSVLVVLGRKEDK